MVRKTELTLAEKLAVLVEYGKRRGISTTAKSIAHATGENPTNIQRILSGENINPRLRTRRTKQILNLKFWPKSSDAPAA